MPDVTSISILGRPEMVRAGSAEGWYARGDLPRGRHRAVVGPFPSSRQARSELMDVAGRGQIGTWDEWTVDHHLVVGCVRRAVSADKARTRHATTCSVTS
ncbi:MAG TPA: hypothetical protein VHS27_10860 [Gaiellales bacterium]|nr:hypothetical protein [Gaiellales bacterium]